MKMMKSGRTAYLLALLLVMACCGCGDDDDEIAEGDGVLVFLHHGGGDSKPFRAPPGTMLTGPQGFADLPENTLWTTLEGGRGEMIVTEKIENHAMHPVTVTYVDSQADLESMHRNPGGMYMLVRDISLVGEWKPVEEFSGVFDGRGHRIKNLRATGSRAGLFAKLTGIARNVSLDVRISAFGSGRVAAGGLAAEFSGHGLANIHVRGTISASGEIVSVGGILGSSYDYIADSSADVEITVAAEEDIYAGGISGGDTGVDRCWSRGSIVAECSGYHAFVGGIIPIAASSTVEQTYSTMDLSGKGRWAIVGGITGVNSKLVRESYHALGKIRGSITTANPFYANAGGIVAENMGNVERCVSDPGDVWAQEEMYYGQGGIAATVSKNAAVGDCRSTFRNGAGRAGQHPGSFDDGAPATTAELKGRGIYDALDWDFEAVWEMGGGSYGYPVFKGAAPADVPPCDCVPVTNERELRAMADAPEQCYELKNDIALSGRWTPIPVFSGLLKGGGHSITNLAAGGDNAGLFARLEGEVRDLDIEVSIDASGAGRVAAGGLAADFSGKAVNVAITGTIRATGDGDVYAGGIVGRGFGTITRSGAKVDIDAKAGKDVHAGGVAAEASDIQRCSSSGTLTAASEAGRAYAGGISGQTAFVSQTCSDMNVTGSGMDACAGGITGANSGGVIRESYYSAGAVAAIARDPGAAHAGGIAGRNGASILRCAAAPGSVTASGAAIFGRGGIAGDDSGTVKSCLSNVSGASRSREKAGTHNDGKVLDLPALLREKVFASHLNWDMDGVWRMEKGDGGFPVFVR